MLDINENLNPEPEEAELTEEAARRALEAARDAENAAYHGMGHAAALTERQKGVMELIKLEEIDSPSKEQLDRKCQLILESYYLPRIAKDGFVPKLDQEFTRSGEPERDYIEAVFTHPSGKKISIGYNYKPDEDGRNILIFEKTFENKILKPGDPEKYVLYGADGTTELESVSLEELDKKLARGEVVKVEEGYFQKAKNKDGEILKGDTTVIVEEEGNSNVKIFMGNNEQEKFSIGKTGQLVCATTNDVTTATVETRRFASEGPIYNSADEARAAAEREIREGETNPHIDVAMEGTTVAEFNYIPTFTTIVELAGLSRKLGKGIEGYEPNESDEENLRKQLAKPINEYLSEKGYYVLEITCENLEADVKENVGFMNTIKTYQMTGGTISVTYTKKYTGNVTLKQKLLGKGHNNDTDSILAQLPHGSELLNPQDIDWKSSKPEVEYITRADVTGTGSAKTVPEADEKAVQNAIQEAQKVVVRSINGGIASGIREAIAGRGAASTVANVRARLNTGVVSKEDMQLTHKETKYAYTGSCDKMVSSVENKLVAVTTWNGSLLTYVEPTEPIIDKGIPTDENYDKYVNEGDDLDILVFEKDDRGLRRYVDEVQDAQNQAKHALEVYERARLELREAQEIFDRIMDEKFQFAEEPEIEEVQITPKIEAETVAEQLHIIENPETVVELTELQAGAEPEIIEEPEVTEEPEIPEVPETVEEPQALGEPQLSAQEALLAIFGEDASETETVEEPVYTMPTVAELMKTAPAETASVQTAPMEVEPMQTAPTEIDVDDAWEKLLMGIPKEE